MHGSWRATEYYILSVVPILAVGSTENGIRESLPRMQDPVHSQNLIPGMYMLVG